jgi:predicted Rossmann fold flavoprotein
MNREPEPRTANLERRTDEDHCSRTRRVVVIGAGAAGSMAAIFAAASGAETLLLERTADGGRKILISGGGRCNILPARLDESRFVSDSPPHLVRRIVRSWPLREQIAFFERELGLPLVEEVESAKLFPASQRARDVRDRLLDLAERRGARLRMKTTVTGFGPEDGGWRVEIQDAAPLRADALVVATGGLSVPSTGSDGAGLRIVETLGHTVRFTYPALTPLVASPAPFAALSGVSLPVTIAARANGLASTATGGFLFTHHGYSGPAVLDVSHVAVRSRLEALDPARLVVRWTSLGDAEWTVALRPRGSRTVLAAVSESLPARLAEALIEAAGVDPRLPLAHLARADRLRLIDTLVRGELPWTGDEGYKKAEVTGGGVSLTEIDPKTMESRRHKRLFLCGEMLDAFGPIGGYNFLWAWATGRAAGLGASATIKGLSPTEGFSP